jgi:hypothetical protein
LAEVWAEKGKASMLYTAEKQPAMFFATCARLIGPEVKLTIEQNYAGLSPNELVLLKEVMARPQPRSAQPSFYAQLIAQGVRKMRKRDRVCYRSNDTIAVTQNAVRSLRRQ